MAVIVGGKVIEGGPPQTISGSGVPVNGTDEVQTITIGGTPEAGSTFCLTYDGWKTAPIAWSATDNTLIANIDAALEALPNIGTGGVTTADANTTSGVGTMTITFVGANGKTDVALIVGSDFLKSDGTASDGTVAVATTTPGVTATGRGAAPGTRYTDYLNGVDYTNTGTAIAPTWTAVSVGNIDQEIIDLAAALPTDAVADVAGAGITIAASNATTIAEADAPAGGTGATAGAYDTAAHRDTAIALINSTKAQVNILITEATELKLDIGTLDTTVLEIKAQLNALLAALRTAGIVTP